MVLGAFIVTKVLPRDGLRCSQEVMNNKVLVICPEHQLFAIEHLLPDIV